MYAIILLREAMKIDCLLEEASDESMIMIKIRF